MILVLVLNFSIKGEEEVNIYKKIESLTPLLDT